MKKFNYSFQGLRGIFALGVLFSHCYFLSDFAQSAFIYDTFLRKLANVDFFFVISGFFAIQSNLNGVTFKQYITKKLIRIYPLYFILLIFFVGMRFMENDMSTLSDWLYLGLNLLLMQNWGGIGAMNKFYMVSWFLSSLLFCYIIVYWLIRIKNKNESQFWKMLYIVTPILLVLKCLAAFAFPTGNVGYYLCYLFPLSGLTNFLIGILVARLCDKINFNFNNKCSLSLQLISIVFLLLSFFAKSFFPVNYGRAFLMLPATAFIVFAFSTETNFSKYVFGNKFLLFLGNISFEIYLLHNLFLSIVNKLSIFNFISNKFSPFITLLICIIAIILCAQIYTIVYNMLVEKLKRLETDRNGKIKN